MSIQNMCNLFIHIYERRKKQDSNKCDCQMKNTVDMVSFVFRLKQAQKGFRPLSAM